MADHLDRRSIAFLLMGLLAVLVSPPSSAQARVDVSPSQAQVAVGQDLRINLRWTLSSAVPGAAAQAQSAQGRLVGADGGVVRIIPRALAVTLPGSVPEVLEVGSQSLLAALERGTSQLVYERDWRDSAGQLTTTRVRIAITGSQSGALDIRDVRLVFESGASSLQLADRDQPLFAQAQIAYQGRGGILGYEWQLATPASTRVQAQFRVFDQGQITLRGPSPQTIVSPPLPTEMPGPYRLRFVIREPRAGFVEAAYVVGSTPSLDPLLLLAPEAAAASRRGSSFSWSAVATATAYQLELYRAGERITGMLVPAQPQPQAMLSELAESALDAGCDCRWRVIAYGADGQVVAVSGLRPVRIVASP